MGRVIVSESSQAEVYGTRYEQLFGYCGGTCPSLRSLNWCSVHEPKERRMHKVIVAGVPKILGYNKTNTQITEMGLLCLNAIELEGVWMHMLILCVLNSVPIEYIEWA